MNLFATLLLVFAFVFFIIAAFGNPNPTSPRFNLVHLGLAFVTLAILVGRYAAKALFILAVLMAV